MIPAPEMAAFAERFGFVFRAHEKGDANRSARVEAPFHCIEHGFLAGDAVRRLDGPEPRGARVLRGMERQVPNKLHASRRELFAAEQPHLKPLPLLCRRCISSTPASSTPRATSTSTASATRLPYLLIGRPLEVRETLDRIDLYEGPRRVASHARVFGRSDTRVTDPGIARRAARARPTPQPAPEETSCCTLEPRPASMWQALKQRSRLTGALPLRRLLSMLHEYPRAAFLSAVALPSSIGSSIWIGSRRWCCAQSPDEYFVLTLEPDVRR